MNIRLIIITILIGANGLLFAQPSKSDRKKAHKEIKTYVQENIIPVIKPIREDFDNQLSTSEKAELAEVRNALQEAREAKRGMSRPERGEEPTEAQKEALHEMRNAHRKLMMRVWTIADNHEAELKQIKEELKPQMKTWREDMKKIMESHRPAHPEGKEMGEHPHHKGKNGEQHHRGPRHGKMGHHGKGGFGKLTSPTGFLLWDTTKDLPSDNTISDLKAFPNPALTTSTLEFHLEEAGPVTVKLINSRGETLKTLKDGNLEAGSHKIQANISDLKQGLYFYQITTDSEVATQKIWVKKVD